MFSKRTEDSERSVRLQFASMIAKPHGATKLGLIERGGGQASGAVAAST